MVFGKFIGGAVPPPDPVVPVPPPPSDPARFWQIIATTQGAADPDAKADLLEAVLSQLEPAEIEAFDADYRRFLNKAYRWDLWGAAYVALGGCSDDEFDYFCDWLISVGQSAYEQGMVDPDGLVAILTALPVEQEPELEDFRYAAGAAYLARTGRDIPWFDIPRPTDPAGDAWSEEALPGLFPKLTDWADAR